MLEFKKIPPNCVEVFNDEEINIAQLMNNGAYWVLYSVPDSVVLYREDLKEINRKLKQLNKELNNA